METRKELDRKMSKWTDILLFMGFITIIVLGACSNSNDNRNKSQENSTISSNLNRKYIMSKKYSTYSFKLNGESHTFQGRFNDDTGLYEAIFKGVTGHGSSLQEAINDAINEYQSI